MLTLIRVEFAKLYARRGIYVGYGVFLALVLAVAIPIFCYRDSVQTSLREQAVEHEMAPIAMERSLAGPFIPRLMLFMPLRVMVVNTLLGFFAAMVGGSAIAGEYGSGTLRLMVTRPPHRWQLVVAKFVTASLHSAGLALFLGLCAFGAGYAFFGRGPLVFMDVGDGPGRGELLAPFLSEGDALQRLALAYGLMALGAASVAAMALFLSSFTSHSLTATGVAFGIVLLCGVLGVLGRAPEEITFFAFFRTIRPYLITTHINVYDAPLYLTIDWGRVHTSLAWLAGYTAFFLTGAIVLFSRREIRC